MQKLSTSVWIAIMCLVFSTVITSCTDNNYDLNEVDTTVGIGSGELKIPVSSTTQIPLADVLTLTENGIVKIMDNGDYMISREGDNVNPATPSINNIYVSGQINKANDVTISLASAAPARTKSSQQINGEADIWRINYESSPQNDIEDLTWATLNADVTLQVKLSNLSNVLSQVRTIKLDMPDYMELTNVRFDGNIGSWSQTNSGLVFNNIGTERDLSISFNISKMHFGNQLSFNSTTKKVSMLGDVHMGVAIDASDIRTGIIPPSSLTFATSMNLGEITILGAYGRFNPSIDLGNLGETNFGDIPKFLKDKDVVADLYNPQIYLDIANNMTIGGYINGTLKAYKDGSLTSSVSIPDVPIASAATSHLCICRLAEGVANSNYSPIVVSNLSNLIATIPDKVVFEAKARADKDTYYQLTLGQTFEIAPKYNISTPIAFGKDARIVYNDSIDNLNKDIKDIDLAEGAYLQANANIENRIPAHLSLSAEAYGLDKKPIGSDLIEIEVSNNVIASADGETPITTPIEIKIKQHKKGALKMVDGIAVRIEGAATDDNNSVVGVTLNANKHTLTAKDIVIKLIGKIIADL